MVKPVVAIALAAVAVALAAAVLYTAFGQPLQALHSGTTAYTTASTSSATTTMLATTTTAANASAHGYYSQNSTDFIIASPVNTSQVYSISKFRSCLGHDYSGYDTQGYLETNRSMKHYFSPTSQLRGSVGRIQEFAPFNGTVESITEEHTPVGKQVWIGYTESGPEFGYPPPDTWTMVFFHMDPLPGVTVGSHVAAGQLVGYANQTAPVNQTFDIALVQYSISTSGYRQILDSMFNRMSPQVLERFAAVGVNRSDIIISKEYRDANPCDFNSYNPNDSVTLT